MKKFLLAAAFVFAGLVSAKSAAENKTISKDKTESSEEKDSKRKGGCMQVFVETSCGLNSHTTWCPEWGLACLWSDAEAVEHNNCGE